MNVLLVWSILPEAVYVFLLSNVTAEQLDRLELAHNHLGSDADALEEVVSVISALNNFLVPEVREDMRDASKECPKELLWLAGISVTPVTTSRLVPCEAIVVTGWEL